MIGSVGRIAITSSAIDYPWRNCVCNFSGARKHKAIKPIRQRQHTRGTKMNYWQPDPTRTRRKLQNKLKYSSLESIAYGPCL